MTVLDLESFCETGKKLIDQRLEELIPLHPGIPYESLFSAARYSLLSAAKRLRPLLVLATAETYGAELEKALDPACALEMVHTYSLIHDDLPSMDDDDFRRGKLTLHKVYPESHAILAGDYLLTYAFEVVSRSQGLTDSQKLKLVRSLSEHSGAHGMIGGQIIDLDSEGQKINFPTLEMMHHYKTASLMISALEFGGIIGHAPAEDLLTLNQIGKKVGIAFQVIDDTLDVTGSFEEMGKKSGSDQAQHKSTALSLMSLEECQLYASELLDSAYADLKTLSQKGTLLEQLFYRLVNRKN